jgi:hypothetical protein
MLILPSGASAAGINVYTYGARPVVVAPAPRVYVAPARAAVVGPRSIAPFVIASKPLELTNGRRVSSPAQLGGLLAGTSSISGVKLC